MSYEQKSVFRAALADYIANKPVHQASPHPEEITLMQCCIESAGVDGLKSLTPKQRLALVANLKLSSKVAPTRRVWIPKPGTDEKRPLGIPTMNDRALQALVKLALEPEWEARFEPNSYGFRPGRSCLDAIEAIFGATRLKPKYVLDADIAKCFERIDHEALLKKLNTFPTIRRQIRAWLKAGVIDDKQLFPTSEGTPQGGVISPLLANIALHGMEERIKQFAETIDLKDHRGRQQGKRDKRSSISLIRYADDFVILHEDITVVTRCREIISLWLNGMGLELKPSKTRLAHTLNQYEQEKPGFDFLGFTIQQYPAGKYHSNQGFKTIITPSKRKQKVHYDRIASIIESHKSAPQAALIRRLNPIIRGWANYYAAVVSKVAYSDIDNLGKCTHCGLFFREDDVMEVDHRIPKSQGGKDSFENFDLLHRHCHDTKTALDGSLGTASWSRSQDFRLAGILDWNAIQHR